MAVTVVKKSHGGIDYLIATIQEGPQVATQVTLWGITHSSGIREVSLKIEKLKKVKILGSEMKVGLDETNPNSRVTVEQHGLDNLIEFLNANVGPVKAGPGTYVTVPDRDAAKLVQELAEALKKLDPSKLLEIAAQGGLLPDDVLDVQVLRLRQQAVASFQDHLSKGDWKEPDWQKFFEKETWIFGHALAFQFLHVLQPQALVGGKTVANQEGQVIDYLMATAAKRARFTALVEIKTPDAPLLEDKQYRNRTYTPGFELSGGVAQLLSNCQTWATRGAVEPETVKENAKVDILTVEPKGILVAGHTGQFGDDDDRKTCFELYRRSLRNPEIITFDELLERAKYLITMPATK